MTLSTLQKQKSGIGTTLIYVLAVLGVGLLVFFAGDLIKSLGLLKGKSALSTDVVNGKAEVFVNGASIGSTPLDISDITPGDNKITIKGQNRQYETTIKFLPSNGKYIHKVGVFRDLGVSDMFSSGKDFWFEEDNSGTVLRVISEPQGASVFIDNTEVGKTPFTSNSLTENDYDLKVSMQGFEEQTARIKIQKGYTSNVSVKLFPLPTPTKVDELEIASGFYNIPSDNPQVYTDTQTWVKALLYWTDTRGVNVGGAGLNKEHVFEYYIDYKGNVYDKDGNAVTEKDKLAALKDAKKRAYLGKASDGASITQEAKDTLNQMGASAGGKKVKILETGLGWLRVRSEPDTEADEVTKVDVGATYEVLEEGTGWTKIKVDATTQGWVNSSYTEAVEEEAETPPAQ